MKLTRSLLALFLNLSLVSVSFLSFAIQSAHAQDSKIALQRGYRTGYSDGYMSGYRDVLDNSAKNYSKHSEYTKADRAYNKDYGTLEDYRDGYQQGFEAGYDTGFDKKAFDATIPTDLKKRGVIANQTTTATQNTTATEITTNNPATTTTENNTQISENTQTDTNNNQSTVSTTETTNYQSNNDAILLIPTNTDLIIELLDDISTERNREGDKFTARIISPVELSGAIIEGRVSKIQKPGRIKRRSEMLLTFDRLVLTDNRWTNFSAILTEVLPSKGDNVKRVNTEGTVEGKSSIKSDAVKVGASTGTGLVVGAIVGGPVGAGVGAAVGAAFGVGAVVVERGKHIRLNKNQQLKIKTVYETQIR